MALLSFAPSPIPSNLVRHRTQNYARLKPSCCCNCGRRKLIGLIGSTFAGGFGGVSGQAVPLKKPEYLDVLNAVHPSRPGWYEELYAQALVQGMRSYENQMAEYKIRLFNQLDHDAQTILELGIGTGANLKYYYNSRPGIKIIGVDPNTHMEKYCRAAAAASGIPEANFKFVHAVGESLPVASSSVDAVVGTLVMCSVKDIGTTLHEIQRVLKPKGTFFFIEHVAAKGSALRFWQDLLDPVQQLVSDGCHLTRDTLTYINNAGFLDLDVLEVNVEGVSLLSPHIIGSAQV